MVVPNRGACGKWTLPAFSLKWVLGELSHAIVDYDVIPITVSDDLAVLRSTTALPLPNDTDNGPDSEFAHWDLVVCGLTHAFAVDGRRRIVGTDVSAKVCLASKYDGCS
jgi:hypothetical protein